MRIFCITRGHIPSLAVRHTLKSVEFCVPNRAAMLRLQQAGLTAHLAATYEEVLNLVPYREWAGFISEKVVGFEGAPQELYDLAVPEALRSHTVLEPELHDIFKMCIRKANEVDSPVVGFGEGVATWRFHGIAHHSLVLMQNLREHDFKYGIEGNSLKWLTSPRAVCLVNQHLRPVFAKHAMLPDDSTNRIRIAEKYPGLVRVFRGKLRLEFVTAAQLHRWVKVNHA